MADWFRYIASYPDLIAAFGLDVAAAERHYNQTGAAEGRSLTLFEPAIYARLYPDVVRSIGSDPVVLEKHYIAYGYREGRASGVIDPLEYAASNPDVARVFGTDAAALGKHYLDYGFAEKRATATFDPYVYAIANPDVAAAFGSDATALTRHYIDFGIKEGRAATGFDPVAYLLSYRDLQTIGFDAEGAARHYLEYGRREGRLPVAADDQTGHTGSLGKLTTGQFDTGADRDWYKFSLSSAGETRINVLRTGGATGAALTGATINLWDADGHRVATKVVDGDTADRWLSFIYKPAAGAPATTDFYIEIVAPGATGSYALALAQAAPTSEAPPPPFPYFPSGPPAQFYDGDAGTDVFAMRTLQTVFRDRFGNPTNFYSGELRGNGGDDILLGGGGSNRFTGGPGADFMDGGRGYSSVDYAASPAAITVDLSGATPNRGGDAEGDRIFNMTVLVATPFGDRVALSDADGFTVYGGAGDDTLIGGAGFDQLRGERGNNVLIGGAGGDTLSVFYGANTIDGGAGMDIFGFDFDFNDADRPQIGAQIDLRSGRVGGVAAGLAISNVESLYGTKFDDVLATAIVVRDSNYGHFLQGGDGNDILIDRNDFANRAGLSGDGGNDLLIGSSMSGGAGNDTYVLFREDGINFVLDSFTSNSRNIFVVDTFAHRAGTTFTMNASLQVFGGNDAFDLSDLRDEGGAILDFADMQRHMSGLTIDLTGFKTAAGDAVAGRLTLLDGVIGGYPFTSADFNAGNFIFQDGPNWQAMVPADFPIL